jgi:SAM-dependent methyltransferase
MDWLNALICSRCKSRGLLIESTLTGELLPERGRSICAQCGAHFPIHDHVLDLSQRGDNGFLTSAGLSNLLPLLPWAYENVWRPRSLSLLTGEPFPVAREIKLLNDWLMVQPDELVIDLGASTDLYARGLAKQNTSATIIAIDMAPGMLRAGHKYATQEGVANIAHIRAPIQRLPFADASADAVVCGGSLNEFRSMTEALHEARRVIKPDGRMFAMSLLQANSRTGRLSQWSAGWGGIHFPSLVEFNAAIESTGWAQARQQVFGVVVFTLLNPIVRA